MIPPTADAVATVAADPLPRFSRAVTVAFTPESAHVCLLRRIAKAYLALWHISGFLAEDVVLAVSELVTNAVQHGLGGCGLRMMVTVDELRVEVTDANPAPARLRVVGNDEVSGRGLALVAALADAWGVSADGMTTWCSFRLSAEGC